MRSRVESPSGGPEKVALSESYWQIRGQAGIRGDSSVFTFSNLSTRKVLPPGSNPSPRQSMKATPSASRRPTRLWISRGPSGGALKSTQDRAESGIFVCATTRQAPQNVPRHC